MNRFCILATLLLFAGCVIKTGDQQTARVPSRQPTPAPAPTPDPQPAPSPLPAWDDPLDIHVEDPATELAVRMGVRLRSRSNLGFLFGDDKLRIAAEKHAQWMASGGRLGHVGFGGTWPADRVRYEGYPAIAVGEVVAGDFDNPVSVIRGWLSSPGHKATILNPEFTQLGCAVATDRNGRKCWVVVFARPQ